MAQESNIYWETFDYEVENSFVGKASEARGDHMTDVQHSESMMDATEEDFVVMMDDVDTSMPYADHMNHRHLQDGNQEAQEQLPPFYQYQQASPPQSPVPNEINLLSLDEKAAHRVTPEQTSSPLRLPEPHELELQYKRTLKKLAKSIRRSDATRSIVKRQRSSLSVSSALSSDDDVSDDFFRSARFARVEKSRRQLLTMIQHET